MSGLLALIAFVVLLLVAGFVWLIACARAEREALLERDLHRRYRAALATWPTHTDRLPPTPAANSDHVRRQA